MTITSPDNYKFDFAQLAKIAEPHAALISGFNQMAILPTPAEQSVVDGLSDVFIQMAERGGLRAALRRMFPEDGSALVKECDKDGTVCATQKITLPGLMVLRTAYAGGQNEYFAHLRNDNSTPVLLLQDGYDARYLFNPGSWLKTLQDAAEKLPMHRHESPAAFQLSLRQPALKT